MIVRRQSRIVWSLVAAGALILGFPAAGSAQPPKPATNAPANLGVAEYEVPGVQVVLLSLARGTDGFLTLRWGYRNTSTSPKTIGANTTAQAMQWSAPYSLAWDVYVMANGQQYPVVRGNHMLLAMPHAGNAKTIVVLPNQTYATWAKVKDPGSDVKAVSVYIQGVAPFENVPIS